MLETLEALIIAHGSIAVFFIGILEEVVFVIPSAAVFLGAGFLLIPANTSFLDAFGLAVVRIGIPVSLGVTIGSLFIYGLVYAGGKPALKRWGRYLGISWEEIESTLKRFTAGKSDEILLFSLRALPIFPISVVSAACGLVRIKWQEFVWTTLAGAFVRATGTALVGWRVEKAYAVYAAQFEVVEKYGLVILLVLGAAAYWYLRKHFRK
jgi:membrane protein DedA with SNARE-associated domain